MHLTHWLRTHDAGYWALRRAARTAIVMPLLFALGTRVFHNPLLATFAAFGSFAMLLLVDFTGTRRERAEAVLWLGITGAVLVCLGTLASPWPWVAASAMAVVGFVILFLGVVSSVLATASTALLLAFILPVTTAGPVSSIPDRVAGWSLAMGVAVVAVTVLWPAPARTPLRGPAVEACRLLATRLRTDVAFALGHAGVDAAVRDATAERASAAATGLRHAFYATPSRPTGLGTAARTVVRLVDELGWLNAVVDQTPRRLPTPHPSRTVCEVKLAAAAVLERGADLLEHDGDGGTDLAAALDVMRARLAEMEAGATVDLPVRPPSSEGEGEFLDALEPTFRAQEMAFAVTAVAENIGRTVAAERRTWSERLLGRQPDGVGGVFTAVRERAAAHLEVHSVWLHNSLRGAAGLGIAVLVADLTGVQHSFWVVLGTLSVLRSNALSTGQNALRGLLGTAVGILIGGVIVLVIGTSSTVLWILLPIAIVVAGLAPATISFAAGQAAFTVTLVILFNIIAPVGFKVGLIRVEDIAIGCLVSLVVGALFWPRGAASALGRALAEAYAESTQYVRSAVLFGMQRCYGGGSAGPAPEAQSLRAAAASRRLDDAFREYLAERGGKRLQLAEVTTLVTGVIAPRLVGDAVLDLWRRQPPTPGGDTTAALTALRAGADELVAWYALLATALTGHGAVPEPMARDTAVDTAFITAVRRDLTTPGGPASPLAVRMIWTGDHLDAVRRLQGTLVAPARLIAQS